MPFDGKPVTKRRKVPFEIPKGRATIFKEFSNPNFTTLDRETYQGTSVNGIQETVSEGHPWRSRAKGSVEDIGGNFFTTRQYMMGHKFPRASNVDRLNIGGGTRVTVDYDGPIFPINPTSGAFPNSIHSSNATLDTMGATAVARCKPTKSAADIGTALGELYREGLPHLLGHQTWRDRTLGGRQAGKEYLNVQFGWKPLVHDVKAFVNSVINAQKLLIQYERDAGRVVRRKYEFPIERSYSEQKDLSAFTWINPTAQNYLQIQTTPGTYSKITETWRRTWFSGAFSYHLPTGYDSRKELDRLSLLANQIIGLELDPDVLWNLAPWSWAADWFSNTGDVLSNISDAANAGLVMRWGYIMEHSINKVTYKETTSSLRDKRSSASPLTFVTETKVRRRANPFGFGLTWDGLSPYQLSIAAALGISRR